MGGVFSHTPGFTDVLGGLAPAYAFHVVCMIVGSFLVTWGRVPKPAAKEERLSLAK